MAEKELNIVVNGQYKNIKPKKDLEDGDFFIITKKFAEGREVNGKFGISYSCSGFYNGEEVSFFLKPKEHQLYAETGGVDDNVKVFVTEQTKVNPKTGMKFITKDLHFEKV